MFVNVLDWTRENGTDQKTTVKLGSVSYTLPGMPTEYTKEGYAALADDAGKRDEVAKWKTAKVADKGVSGQTSGKVVGNKLADLIRNYGAPAVEAPQVPAPENRVKELAPNGNGKKS